MNRRHLIKLAALSLGGLTFPLTWLRPLRADTLFDDVFGDAGMAVRVGRLHHASDPDGALRGRTLVADLAGLRASARQRRLRERVRTDLARLDLVVVDGWVLARSEADLCAAVHLDRSLA